MADPINLRTLMDVMTRRTINFLTDELEIELQSRGDLQDSTHKIELLHLTSIMGIEGHIGVFLAFSFDEGLIHNALESFADDIDIDEEEKDLYLEEAAMEILNTIVGNATADLGEKGNIITLSPPIIVSEARSVLRHKKARFYSVNLQTSAGELQIHCIGPKELFDDKLNYVSEAT